MTKLKDAASLRCACLAKHGVTLESLLNSFCQDVEIFPIVFQFHGPYKELGHLAKVFRVHRNGGKDDSADW